MLQQIISHHPLHARWLNTLSLMENTGARKIKKCEHPILTTEMILKHAADEARHAHYLKRQIRRLPEQSCPDYADVWLLAPQESRRYLHSLDIRVCRYLKQRAGLKGEELRYAAYLLVTYAIERRADLLYPLYHQALEQAGSPVSVRTVIAEETAHLAEMEHQLSRFSPQWESLGTAACEMEQELFDAWVIALQRDLAGAER